MLNKYSWKARVEVLQVDELMRGRCADWAQQRTSCRKLSWARRESHTHARTQTNTTAERHTGGTGNTRMGNTKHKSTLGNFRGPSYGRNS